MRVSKTRRCYDAVLAAIGELLSKMDQRNRRRARYPALIDQIIKQVDPLNCGSFIAAMTFGVIASNRIDSMGMLVYVMLYLLVSQFAVLTFQENLPEVATVAVVTGASTLPLVFLILFYQLGVPLGPLITVAFILVAMLLGWVYTIIKEDVREPEEDIEQGGSSIPPV